MAHALAPAANILLVETNTGSFNDLFAGVRFAAKQVGVSVVSMSFGGPEFAGEKLFDASLTTPRGHQGVTFVAASGDGGVPGDYPAFSKNALAVGGTKLTLNASGGYGSEIGWGAGAGQLGSGGGVSVVETEPSYQLGVQNSGMRQIPDVAFDASPASGVAIYDTHGYNGQTGWFVVGGTSFSAPAWAALLAISNQGRILAHEGTLVNRQAQTLLYNLPESSFHDIVSGSNGFPAGPGYDLVTGRGTPIANKIAAGLGTVSPAATSDASLTQTASAASQPLEASVTLIISPVTVPVRAPALPSLRRSLRVQQLPPKFTSTALPPTTRPRRLMPALTRPLSRTFRTPMQPPSIAHSLPLTRPSTSTPSPASSMREAPTIPGCQPEARVRAPSSTSDVALAGPSGWCDAAAKGPAAEWRCAACPNFRARSPTETGPL